ncbi:OLC1v1007795C1 [Oldenlandia corymbosa var. corymbosa]|uniref:OLC1v1007795C1 n=1 Tax=Oldenlandia corymbosa var. corymbosa TaxID=529605 RepID=A0AAV1DMM2_OLDCO|nr:OLC1v1007795C1 [Oldenlandia corymbosa var. corymbosa]
MSIHAFGNPNFLQLPHGKCSKLAGLKWIPGAAPSLVVSNAQQSERLASLLAPQNQRVAAIVFGDGSSPSRLYPLTKWRSQGAIPIAGNYRLIDAVVSNCINSHISKIYAITQFNSTSLNSHLSRAYSGALSLGKDGFLEVIAACQTPEEKGWFQGTADAIRRFLWILEEYSCLEFLILPGHHFYKMDYREIIEAHRSNAADITLAVLSSMRDENPGFGFVKLNSEDQVSEFLENPPPDIEIFSAQTSVASDMSIHPGMGIYVISRDVMINLLKEHFPKANDLRCEIIPRAMALGMKVQGYKFHGQWEDMRSIEAFYNANMEILRQRHITSAAHDFHDLNSPLYTLPRRSPPTLIADAVIIDSMVGDGCVLSKCHIRNTVVGMRTRVGEGAIIEDSIIMGSDAYLDRNDFEGASFNGFSKSIPIGIGEGSVIRKAIIDKDVRIGKNVMILNKDNVQEGNREANGYVIRGGIVVIIKGAVITDESIL